MKKNKIRILMYKFKYARIINKRPRYWIHPIRNFVTRTKQGGIINIKYF